MKKQIIQIIGLSILLSSCMTIYFDQPQPVSVADEPYIPEELHGTYVTYLVNEKISLEIGKDFIGEEGDIFVLSDSVVLRKLDNKYFFSKRVNDKPELEGSWEILVMEVNECGNLKASSFVISADDDSQSMVDELMESYDTERIEVSSDEVALKMSITEKEFLKLLESNVLAGMLMERKEK